MTCIDGVQQTVGALLYEPLFTLDASFTPQPVLCERSSCDAQALTWTFALRSAVFSDGTALTANDVLAAYRRAAESARYGARFANVASMKAQDAHTLIVTLTQANGSFPALLDVPTLKASKNQKEDIAAALKALTEKEDSKMLFGGEPEPKPTGTGNLIGQVQKTPGQSTDTLKDALKERYK